MDIQSRAQLETSLDLVTRSTNWLKSDPRAAQSELKILKKSIPTVLSELNKLRVNHESKQMELRSEESFLERQINEKEEAKKKLERSIQDTEAKRARNEALLNDARGDLDRAERQKAKAEKKKDGAIVGTVGGGLAATLLGIAFPPSLLVTVPAVATIGTVAIVEADKAVDECKEKIRSREQDIEREICQIKQANTEIAEIEREVLRLNERQNHLYQERGAVRNTIVFLEQAVTYFGNLHVAVEGGQQRTDVLFKILGKANERQEYKILDSKGTVTVVNSFAEAWKRVEGNILSGEQAGFFSIDFEQQPQLTD